MEFDQLVGIISQGGGFAGDPADDNRGDEALLARNLAALALRSPMEAELIRQSPARRDISFIETEEGLSAEMGGVALASKRRPVSEGAKLAARVESEKIACAAVLGFGLGYHCGALLERLGSKSIVICFEPDLAMLRAVLSRVDCTAMLSTGRLYLVSDTEHATRINSIFSGIEAFVGMGVEIVAHPPSTGRLAGQSDRFGKVFGDALRSARTHVVTTLANSRVSFRNALMNLDHYTRSAGIVGLEGSCAGRAAIVVSAGPSLQRNLELLADPAVRDSFVVIAVQTVLKPMLDRGIRPHFVAALDYHEVSKRFYEDLTAEDVAGIRLIAEPKANPAILDAFPGEVLCVGDDLLDTLLGEELAREMGELRMGATVAHLCYYFARYLGCDPVVFIGQDLGFTDGQYYAPGAAIHRVWAGELNAHRTLEMFEWERIVRMRAHLRPRTDVHGRPIYSDEQMVSYLTQFEEAFAKDEAAGLTVIDASEGGVRKAHTLVMALREAIDAHAGDTGFRIPSTREGRIEDADRARRVAERLAAMIDDCERIADQSDRSIEKLRQMLRHQHDQRRVNTLIGEVNAIRDKVLGMRAAYRLTEFVNQVGVLNRMKRDRAIEVGAGATGLERQRAQIERDIVNVEWTRDAARAVASQLRDGAAAMAGTAPKQTNEMRDAQTEQTPAERLAASGPARDRVHALVIADTEFNGLGTRRDLGTVIGDGLNTLQMTVSRLARCAQLDGITIATDDPGRIKGLLGSLPVGKPLNVVGVDAAVLRGHGARVGAARVQSGECWRSSVGMLSVYDEQAHPGQIAALMHEHGIDACAIVGGDWAMVDPVLVDETVVRLRCQHSEKRIAFSQAVPGIGTMVVDRATMDSLAAALTNGSRRNPLATLGALVGYIPVAPQSDPIVKGVCVQIDPALRDAGVRVVADTPARIGAMRDAYGQLGSGADAASAACVSAFVETYARYSKLCPRTLVMETCTGRLAGGEWGVWKRGSIEPVERPVLSMKDAHAMLRGVRELRDDVAVVFDGAGDPLMHPEAMGLVALAREDGAACVELRTDLQREGLAAAELVESGIDILSVDVLAEQRETYAHLTGQDRLEQVHTRLQDILDTASADPSCPMQLTARITRCDAVYGEIEAFYDKWLMLTGAAVIDPLPAFVRSQRVSALPVPAARAAQIDRSTMRILCDGVVVDRAGHPILSQGAPINAIVEGVGQAYQRMCSAMRAAQIEMKIRTGEYAA
ncbi:MAG: 6-hydroxymethylpterin diphosphokinase MptE-like protein [Phycisphaerales bacterium]